ncbi:hypothetical protein LEP1GSC008_2710 [Leptospira kirschneri serovar Bulgarica str. Nikolaevo]|uniref:Uncharacterized protein n=1 Tax=Leptospira kirschneri serovar Bulgarica str. Nikolaevo TaxID=1240687 RepID=M6FGB0_9LEPT|nr:hypothetical protein LEP1GSC008_2710 [Leptospira kirschneri serovar Bulgarica str. Nikolaevo]
MKLHQNINQISKIKKKSLNPKETFSKYRNLVFYKFYEAYPQR